MMTLQEHVEKLRAAREAVKTATDFIPGRHGYLKHVDVADSSDDSELRIRYVNTAISEFVKKHKREILQRAVELIDEELAIVKTERGD